MSTPPQTARPGASNTSFYALSAATIAKLEEDLQSLQSDCKTRCAVVLDRTGCILASTGEFDSLNPETVGAIAAAAVAALNSLVSRAASQEVSIRFYGSDIERIHFALITDRLILTLLQSEKTPTSTLRARIKSFIGTIRPLVERDQTRPGPLSSVEFIEKKLDELFRDVPK